MYFTALKWGDDIALDAALAYLHTFKSDALQALCGALIRLRRADAEDVALAILSRHAKTPSDDLAALDVLERVGARRSLVTLTSMRDAAPVDEHGVHARLDAVVEILTARLGAVAKPGALTSVADTFGGDLGLATHTGHELSLAIHMPRSSSRRAVTNDPERTWLDAAPPGQTPPMTSWVARTLLMLTQALSPHSARMTSVFAAHLCAPLYVLLYTGLVVLTDGPGSDLTLITATVSGVYTLSLVWWAAWWALDSLQRVEGGLSPRLRRGRSVNALVDQAHTPRLLRGSERGRLVTRVRYLEGGVVQERWLTCHYSTANTDRVRAWIDGDSIVVFGVDTPIILSDSGRWTVTHHARSILTAAMLSSPSGLVCLSWLLTA